MCRAIGMPRVRSNGKNGAFAALNTNATSAASAASTARAVDSPVWLRVSSCFTGIAGRWTTFIPRY